jgi:hypothetical protein
VTISLAVGVASKAFDAIKQGFAIGRDLEQMSGDLSRWMGAVSDVDNAEKQAKNPPLFKKLFDKQSIEQAAIQAYTAKKKLEEQRYELKMFLNMTYGHQAYNELLAMEGQIRKERQELVYKQQKMRQQIFEIVGWFFIAALVIGFFGLVANIWIKNARADSYTYKPKEYTTKQKINQGITPNPKYTTCRLKKRIKSQTTGKQACIYQGGNRTYEMMIESWCPKQYKCIYNPNQDEPNIDKVMESLRSVAK